MCIPKSGYKYLGRMTGRQLALRQEKTSMRTIEICTKSWKNNLSITQFFMDSRVQGVLSATDANEFGSPQDTEHLSLPSFHPCREPVVQIHRLTGNATIFSLGWVDGRFSKGEERAGGVNVRCACLLSAATV